MSMPNNLLTSVIDNLSIGKMSLKYVAKIYINNLYG